MEPKQLAGNPLIYSIDDDPAMNELMKARFESYGCEIETFTQAQQLLERIQARRPALLVLDLNLGQELDGFNIIEKIRQEFKYEFPIIVVSSETENSQIAHALEIGATDFVVKPPFRFQFEEKVAEYIRASELADPVETQIRPINPAQPLKIKFKMTVREVSPLGFTLYSSHLIKKGASFWLSGDLIKKVVPSRDRVLVTVLSSAMQLTEVQKVYQIRVEIDSTDDPVVQDIKNFLIAVQAGAN